MVQGSHGSVERTPGALFRGMGALFLLKKPDCSRESLARELQEHLRTLGVEYHVHTLKRQLAGGVSSVPPRGPGSHAPCPASGRRAPDRSRHREGAGRRRPVGGSGRAPARVPLHTRFAFRTAERAGPRTCVTSTSPSSFRARGSHGPDGGQPRQPALRRASG